MQDEEQPEYQEEGIDGVDLPEAAVFSEDAIEEAYLQALRASEEAGLMPEIPPLAEGNAWEDYPGEETSLTDGDTYAESHDSVEEPAEAALHARFKPQQIIESLLFVGGEKLTAKRLAGLLGQHCTEEQVRSWIEEVGSRYESQGRPYEVVLGADGYQLALRESFQAQRHLLFGLGPREVKLSQEVLEVLAFIAYQQPVTPEELQEIDRPNVMAAVRQLVRRELVTLERGQGEEPDRYQTTPRFLQLFGLTQLADLPRSRDLAMK